MGRHLKRQIAKYMNRRLKHLASDIQAIEGAAKDEISRFKQEVHDEIQETIVPLVDEIAKGSESRDWRLVDAALEKLRHQLSIDEPTDTKVEDVPSTLP